MVVAAGDTLILEVVSPDGNHLTVPEQLVIVSVTVSPLQMVVLVALILGAGGGVTTVMVEAALTALSQPVVLSLQVAVYDVFTVGDTVIEAVV